MKRILLAALCLAALLPGCARPAAEADAPAHEARRVPILMYHSILRDAKRAGKYVLSPDALERDVSWLVSRGYETVTLRALTEFAAGRGTLPEKPVVLTFDDGYYNNLLYALPILEKYDCVAVLSVVGKYTETFSASPDPNPNYAHVSWDEIAALAEGGRFEIQNHSYDMHGQAARMGSGRKKGESDAAYRKAFCADTQRLQDELTRRAGVTPAFYTYPFGVVGEGSGEYLRQMGFSGSLTCRERTSVVISGDPGTLWALGRYNRPSDVSTEAFMARVLGAEA